MQNLFLCASLVLFANAASALPAQGGIYDTRTKTWLTVEQLAAALPVGTIVVLGEQHALPDYENDPESRLHHENQRLWLEALRAEAQRRGFHSRLGMEFLAYTHQSAVDGFLSQKLSEAEFLTAVGWGGNPFAPYRELMMAAPSGTWALNIPRDISAQVARGGRESLSPEQAALLPPLWERGGPEYYERFAATMRGHVPEDKIERYFLAQCLWDDTMAWRAVQNMGANDILTIIVGEFHAEYGHGLPARLHRHGASSVRTMIQTALPRSQSPEGPLEPDPQFGDRADYIWVYFLD